MKIDWLALEMGWDGQNNYMPAPPVKDDDDN